MSDSHLATERKNDHVNKQTLEKLLRLFDYCCLCCQQCHKFWIYDIKRKNTNNTDFLYSLTDICLLCSSILIREKKHLLIKKKKFVSVFDYLKYMKDDIDDVLNFVDFSIKK